MFEVLRKWSTSVTVTPINVKTTYKQSYVYSMLLQKKVLPEAEIQLFKQWALSGYFSSSRRLPALGRFYLETTCYY